MNNYTIDRKRWATLTIFEQMGNIYVEVIRTLKAKKAGDNERAEASMKRVVDLFDATTEVHSSSPKGTEVKIVKGIFLDEYKKGMTTTLENYLLQYALAARLQR